MSAPVDISAEAVERLAQQHSDAADSCEYDGFLGEAKYHRIRTATLRALRAALDAAEREIDHYQDLAYYEVGGSPRLWMDRAEAAERKLHDYGHDDWYCGGTVPGSFKAVPSYRELRAERDAADATGYARGVRDAAQRVAERSHVLAMHILALLPPNAPPAQPDALAMLRRVVAWAEQSGAALDANWWHEAQAMIKETKDEQ